MPSETPRTPSTENPQPQTRRPKGFAALPPEQRRAIASLGGQRAHAKGTAHEFTSEEARVAGRKGGQVAHAKGTAHEFTSEEARAAGRKAHAQQGSPVE